MIPIHDSTKLFVILCLFFLIAQFKVFGQCKLTATPNSLTFSRIGESKTVSIDNKTNCPFRVEARPFLDIDIVGRNAITVKLNNNYNYYYYGEYSELTLIYDYNASTLLVIPVQVSLELPFSPGSINCPFSNILSGFSPGTIYNDHYPSGGINNFMYQWQESTDVGYGSTWTDILGATDPDYSCPRLYITTSFRRQVTSGSQIAYSNIITIIITPSLNGGTISCNSSSIVFGTSPGSINNLSGPSGGSGGYTYQWEQSTDGGSTWSSIPGATAVTYPCPVLTATTLFRRKVSSGSQTSISNIVTITVTLPEILPSSDHNYVLTKMMLDNTGKQSFNRIDYYDGLGRAEETVMHKASPGGKDIATLQEYDAVGRPHISYIPVPVSTFMGGHVSHDIVKSLSNDFYGDDRAYDWTVYESSPLNRIKEQYGPGAAWHTGQKRVTTGYLANSTSGELSCALYVVASASSLQRKGLYAAGELYVTKTTGEDGHVSYTFTDKLGQVVLERVMDGTVMNDTYYVYDDFGCLRYVLPPSSSELLTATATWPDTHTALVNYAYVYKYDGRNRCIQKWLPGIDSVEMRYDKADRLVFSQDGNQRSKPEKEWTFHLYDDFGRPTVTGVLVSDTVPDMTETVVRSTYNGGTALGGYFAIPSLSGSVKLLTVNYYDDHVFTAGVSQLAYVDPPSGYDARYSNAKGLLTGTRIYRLEDPTKYTASALYYDHRGRVVQAHSSNSLGGFDDEYYAYTFTGKVKQRRQVHSAPGKSAHAETYYYDYGSPATNPTERLLSVSHKLNSAAQVTLAQYTYDEVGRVKTKKLGTETTSYSYNVRSWLTQLTGIKFNQTLTYNAAVNGVTPSKVLYNGNISAMKWKSGDETTERGYKFTYDNLARLTAATYGEGTAITSNLNRFNENVTYNDKMGNIKTLTRRGKLNSGYGDIDNLTYTYTGNQLTKVTDAVTTAITYDGAFHFVDGANVDNEYTYDKNGNLTKDLNRKITSITYNSLNLPQAITFSNGNTTTYVYDGVGNKLSVAYQSGSTTTKTEYVGNKVYKNGTLSMLLTEEGYVTLSGTTPTYHYYLKDHQGNNRVVVDQGGTVQQVNHYYPFGGLFGEGVQTSKQPYKFNGKELDRENGLDVTDLGNRGVYHTINRFTTMDRFAEKFPWQSPYVHAGNNSVNYVDVNGDSIWYTVDENIVTMHVTGKVLNTSSDNINIKRAASDITSRIDAAFSGKFKVGDQTYTLQTDIQLDAVSSMGDVTASDHLFNIVDADGKGARGAVNEIGGKVINVASVDYANDNWFSNTFSWNNTRTAVHEFGHVAGLTHESASGWANLMKQGGVGTNVTPNQRLIMINRASSINRGANSHMGRPYPYLHGYNPVTRRMETSTVQRVFNPSHYKKR